MNKLFVVTLFNCLFFTFLTGSAHAQDESDIWKEFTSLVKKGFPKEKVKGYYPSMNEPIMGYLKIIRENVDWDEFQKEPETVKVKDHIHYLVPLAFEAENITYCFTILLENGKWYFRQLETILLRLDKIKSFPAKEFPDLPEKQKCRMREEIRISDRIRLFNTLSELKTKEYALNYFKDGYGYALAAKVWIPFVPPEKALVLYTAWEQSRMKGNEVILEQLEEKKAKIRFKPYYFILYKQAAHLKSKIGFEDYRNIFETARQDLAEKTG